MLRSLIIVRLLQRLCLLKKLPRLGGSQLQIALTGRNDLQRQVVQMRAADGANVDVEEGFVTKEPIVSRQTQIPQEAQCCMVKSLSTSACEETWWKSNGLRCLLFLDPHPNQMLSLLGRFEGEDE